MYEPLLSVGTGLGSYATSTFKPSDGHGLVLSSHNEERKSLPIASWGAEERSPMVWGLSLRSMRIILPLL